MEKGLVSLNGLLVSDQIFEVPPYQRQYSWEKDQLDDLWNDLFYLDPKKKHFFGTILLKETGEKKTVGLTTFGLSQIIDGQQRLTTVLILIKEILTQLKQLGQKDIEPEEIRKIEESYLKYKDVYKLSLLGDDAEFFQKNIVENVEYPRELLTPSRRRLLQAKQFFERRLEGVKKEKPSKFKDFLLELKAKVDSLEIIRYSVEKDEDAVLIFETVNDRGKPLSRLDKTKSFLMHMIYLSSEDDPSAKLVQVNAKFAKVFRYLEQITNTKRGKDLDEESIQRYHFIVSQSSIKEDIQDYLEFVKRKVRELYRTGANNDECVKFALDYSSDLERYFFALKEIVEYMETDETGIWLKRFFTLGRTANFLPLMLAVWVKTKDKPEKRVAILEAMEKFVFRVYVIGKRRADAAESQLYTLANRLYNETVTLNQAKTELLEIIERYESDDYFGDDLNREDLYEEVSERDIKYLFYEYERYRREQEKENLAIEMDDWLSKKFEIEHIWAQNADVPERLEDIHAEAVNKVGNLTVASKSWNASWGKTEFKSKRKKYAKSSIRIQRDLYEYEKWGKKEIDERGKGISHFALNRWST